MARRNTNPPSELLLAVEGMMPEYILERKRQLGWKECVPEIKSKISDGFEIIQVTLHFSSPDQSKDHLEGFSVAFDYWGKVDVRAGYFRWQPVDLIEKLIKNELKELGNKDLPSRNNPASSLGSIALAGLAGFLLGKK